MSSQLMAQLPAFIPAIQESASCLPWYGIRTRSNHEKIAAAVLESKGFEQYLPLYRSRRRWSDRVVITDAPLFPGYLFCRFDHKQRLPIMTTPGVVSIVGFGNEPTPIDEREVEAVQAILNSGLMSEPHPFLREGQRVRIKHGPLRDLEGILIKKKSAVCLVVSVVMLQRSVSVEIDPDWVASC